MSRRPTADRPTPERTAAVLEPLAPQGGRGTGRSGSGTGSATSGSPVGSNSGQPDVLVLLEAHDDVLPDVDFGRVAAHDGGGQTDAGVLGEGHHGDGVGRLERGMPAVLVHREADDRAPARDDRRLPRGAPARRADRHRRVDEGGARRAALNAQPAVGAGGPEPLGGSTSAREAAASPGPVPQERRCPLPQRAEDLRQVDRGADARCRRADDRHRVDGTVRRVARRPLGHVLEGKANRISTSRGASPSTVSRQPVGWMSKDGSRSAVQYHVAPKLISGLATAHAQDPHPLRRHGARIDRPGRDLRRPAGDRHLAAGLHRVEREPQRLRHEPERRAEALGAVGPSARVEAGGVRSRSP